MDMLAEKIVIFGKMFGVWGMVFAVPATALLKTAFDRLYKWKKEFKRQIME